MVNSLVAAATLAEVGAEFRNIICNIICIIWYVIGAIAALALLILGVKYMSVESLEERENVRRNIIYVIIGLIIVIIAPFAANYLADALGILPLSCDCFPFGN